MRAVAVILLVIVLAVGAWLLRAYYLPSERAEGSPSREAPAETQPAADASPAAPEESASGSGALEENDALRGEAEDFLAQLTEPEPAPLDIESADHFVRPEQTLALIPPEDIEEASAAEVLSDPELGPDTPITVIKEIEEIEYLTPEKLIARSGGDLGQTVRLLRGSEVVETTVREALEIQATSPEKPLSIVKRVRYYEVTTPAEINLDTIVQGEEIIGVIKKPYRLEAATLAELLAEEGLLEEGEDIGEDQIFYVRTVRETDTQGIWGIIHGGLIDNFARGVAIRRGEEVDTYRVQIPVYADEIEQDRSSSFLGQLIHVKTLESYVYNYKHHRMGRNPDLLHPGQEIVIVKFRSEELIDIYKHFVEEPHLSAG